MAWWVALLVTVVSNVLYELLRPKPKFDAPAPASVGDFNFPTIGERRPIPIVWGTCKLTGPLVTWYGLPQGFLDLDAFRAVGQTLATEGLGLSMTWSGWPTSTGRTGSRRRPSRHRISLRSRSKAARSRSRNSPSGASRTRRPRSRPPLAPWAVLACPLATVSIEADRSAWTFRPGTPFTLVWPPLGITGMICRVTRVGTGRLDSGMIEIEAMEDVFGVDWTAYSPPPATGWIDPAGEVPALTDQAALIAPYEAIVDVDDPHQL